MNAVRTAEALDFERFELLVVHLQNTGPLRTRYEQLGVKLVHLPIPNLYSFSTLRQGWRLARLLRHWGADILHSHDLYTNVFAAPWARIFGGCKVLASRRWWYDSPRPGLVPLNRWSYRFANTVLANSSAVAALLRDEEGVPSLKIVEIPNFLDESAFVSHDAGQRLKFRRSLDIPDDAFVVGIVARLAPVKNHEMLLRAAAALDSRFHFVLIGDGPSRHALESLARALGIAPRIHFMGAQSSATNLHVDFDASVLCSNSEGFPNAVIEAMAAARPVVVTKVGGVEDVVSDDVTGLLVPVESSETMASVLLRLRDDPKLALRIALNGQSVVRSRYHRDVVIQKLSDTYVRLANLTPSDQSVLV